MREDRVSNKVSEELAREIAVNEAAWGLLRLLRSRSRPPLVMPVKREGVLVTGAGRVQADDRDEIKPSNIFLEQEPSYAKPSRQTPQEAGNGNAQKVVESHFLP
jgi:hypothetical protein